MTQYDSDKQETYRRLEDAAVRYADLKSVPVVARPEPFVAIEKNQNLTFRQIGDDMRPITGDQIYVRESVAHRLGWASLALAKMNANWALQVVYGYRALSIQQQLFDRFAGQLEGQYQGEELLEAVHRLIAVPSVAGHPTGGAVDIQILSNNQALNFGTDIWEFVANSFTFSPYVSREAQDNRLFLRKIMMAAGFAPFDGEWWHFSFGDKEWARYYNQPAAMYEQTEFTLQA